MKKIGILVKNDSKAQKQADELDAWFKSKDIIVVRKDSSELNSQKPSDKKSRAPSDLLCIFVLGGDGTFLSAVRWIGDQDIPLLGVKFGKVGFLAEIAEENLFCAAKAILKSEYTINPRARLFVEVKRDGKELIEETVLNDVVINKGAIARLVAIKTYINNHYLTTFKADGLIVATPTGSTAYSLAAGGPIVHPCVPGVVITPICPFTLTNRPLIVPDNVSIEIKLEKKSSPIILTFDGQVGLDIDSRNTIIIRKGNHPVNMITLPNQQYYDILKKKLRWSGGRV